MSKKKTNTRPTPVKTATTKSKKGGLNDARETKKFLQILGVCTLVLVFLLYLIFMRSAG
jgi:hypothetical protein